MERVIDFYMFFGALFSVIIALGLLGQKKESPVNYIYSFSFFGLGFWLLQMSLYASGVFPGCHLIKIIIIPITLSVPPLMVMRYRWIISSRFQLDRKYALLFIPAAASCLYIAAPLFDGSLQFRDGYLLAQSVLDAPYREMPLYFKILYLLYPLPKVYLVIAMIPSLISMAILLKRSAGFKTSNISRSGYVFAILIVLSNVIAVYGDLFSVLVLRFAMVMANTTMIVLYMVTQWRPDYNRLLKIETRKARYEQSRLRGLDVDSIIARLHEIMNDEKAFADEELSLKDLADDLGISTHQLSEILNEKLQKNFNSFVNEFRVEEAKRLLVDEPDRSILSVGIASGFNSNTTFSTVFAKMTGLSPGQYRKERFK